MLALMLNVLQERHLKYILYFFGLVTVGSGGFYINGTNQLNPGPEVKLNSEQKVILIGLLDDVKNFLIDENDV